MLPDAELRVVNTGAVDDNDLSGILGAGAGRAPEVERGFAGTALTGVGIVG